MKYIVFLVFCVPLWASSMHLEGEGTDSSVVQTRVPSSSFDEDDQELGSLPRSVSAEGQHGHLSFPRAVSY